LIQTEKIVESDEYFKTLKRKLTAFLGNAPVVVNVVYTPTNIEIIDETKHLSKKFLIDYDKDISKFINEIKSFLEENLYPIIIKKNILVSKYTDTEINDLIEKDKTLCVEDLILNKKKTIIEVRYRIEKVFTDSKKNEIILLDIDKDQLEHYKIINMPVLVLLKNIREKWNQYYSYEVFKSKSSLIKILSKNFSEDN
jgi:hypothetical protein